MIIGIHQPNYIPWLGYFYKIAKSDKFVFLDDVQYIKNSFINRNKIKTPQGDCWLTLPVNFKGNFGSDISDIKLKNELKWAEKHLKTIEMNYKKAKHFNEYYEELREIYNLNYENLSDLNITLIKYFMDKLHINTPTFLSSELSISGTSTDRLVDICLNLKGDVYFSGKGGEKYQDDNLFDQNGIKLVYTDFEHPKYDQLWGEFLPYMSILDLLLNCGDESGKILGITNI